MNMKWLEELFGIKATDINQFIVKAGTNLILAILIFVIGFWLAKVLAKTMRRILRSSNVDEGLITFSASFVSMVVKVMVVVTAIAQLGVHMSSFVALLASLI